MEKTHQIATVSDYGEVDADDVPTCFVGHRLNHGRLAGAGRAVQKDAESARSAESLVLFGRSEHLEPRLDAALDFIVEEGVFQANVALERHTGQENLRTM